MEPLFGIVNQIKALIGLKILLFDLSDCTFAIVYSNKIIE